MKKTLYDLLGIPLGASRGDIAAAYERLQRKFDPELPENRGNPDAEIQFKAIKEAYAVLSDPARRDAYDAALARSAQDIAAPPSPRKSGSNTNRILIYALSGLIGFAVISQAVVQWRALQLSREAAEQNRSYVEAMEQAERETQDPELQAAREEAAQQRRQQWEEENRQREAQRAEERQRREMEDARRYGARVSSELARSEAAAQRKEEYERQRLEQQQRYEQERQEREALRRLEAEKRRLRELEYQNRR